MIKLSEKTNISAYSEHLYACVLFPDMVRDSHWLEGKRETLGFCPLPCLFKVLSCSVIMKDIIQPVECRLPAKEIPFFLVAPNLYAHMYNGVFFPPSHHPSTGIHLADSLCDSNPNAELLMQINIGCACGRYSFPWWQKGGG